MLKVIIIQDTQKHGKLRCLIGDTSDFNFANAETAWAEYMKEGRSVKEFARDFGFTEMASDDIAVVDFADSYWDGSTAVTNVPDYAALYARIDAIVDEIDSLESMSLDEKIENYGYGWKKHLEDLYDELDTISDEFPDDDESED